VKVVVAGEELLLRAEKAAYWPRRKTLFAADLHWGKTAAFLAGGIPVPQAGTAKDLERLAGVLSATGAERLVILGDLFHAKAGLAPHLLDEVAAWRSQHQELDIILVRGNHDARSGDPPPGWRFECGAAPLLETPFAYCHYPDALAGSYVLAGHLHPGIILRGRGRQALRLPCFHFGLSVGILPAFGSFTGTAEITLQEGDRTFAVAAEEIVGPLAGDCDFDRER
jgi:uncharacterized protein